MTFLNRFATIVGGLLLSLSLAHADALNYWNPASSGTTNTLNAVLYTNNMFIVVGKNGAILTSHDGISWAAQASGTTNNLNGLAFGGGKFVIAGAGDLMLTSTNGTNWTPSTTGGGYDLNSVTYGQGKFVTVGNTGLGFNKVFTSTDGTNWSQTFYLPGQDVFNYINLSSLSFGNGVFVAMGNGQAFRNSLGGNDSDVWSSVDATNWVESNDLFLGQGSTLTSIDGRFYLARLFPSPSLQYSTNGVLWSYLDGYSPISTFAITGGKDPRSNNIVLLMNEFGGTANTIKNITQTNQAVRVHTTVAGSLCTAVAYGLNPAGPGEFVALSGSNIIYSIIYPGPYYWTSTVSGNWSGATNWSPQQVPDIYDDVIINGPGNYTVALDTAAGNNLNSLTIGGTNGTSGGSQTLFLNGGTFNPGPVVLTNGGGLYASNFLTLNGAVTVQNGGVFSVYRNARPTAPVVVQNGGAMFVDTASLPSAVTIANGGQLTANNNYSYIETTGSLTVNAGGVINMNAYFYLNGPLTNYGSIFQHGNNWFYIYNDGTVNYQGKMVNQAGGLITQAGPGGGINSSYGQESFINRGTFYKTTGDSTSINTPIFDNSSGLITNAAGYLTLSTLQNSLTGSYASGSNAVIQFIGGSVTNPIVPGAPFNLQGPGAFSFVGGTLLLPTDIVSNLYLQGGLLELGTSFQGGAITNLTINGMFMTNTLPVTGKLNLGYHTTIYGSLLVTNGGVVNSDGVEIHANVRVRSGGILNAINSNTDVDNDGSLTIDAGGQLNMTAYIYLYGPLTNAGTVTMQGNNWIYIYNDNAGNLGLLLNQPGGVIDQQGNGSFSGNYGYARFINQGLYHKSYAGDASMNVNIFDNSAGVVSNSVGTLVLGTYTNQLTGTYGAAAGSVIQYFGGTASSPLVAGNPLVFNGAGDNVFVGGVLLLPTNTIPGLTLRYGTLLLGPAFQGGAITNLNIQYMTLTNTLPVTGNLTMLNNSVLTGSTVVQNGGTLTMTGNYIHGGLTIGNGGHLIGIGSPLNFAADSWLTINAGGLADIGYYMLMSGPLTNAGTFNFNDYNPIFVYNNGSSTFGGVVNQPGGVINLPNNGTFSAGSGSEYLINRGTINKTAPLNTTLAMNHFTNYGVISSAHGSFQLNNVNLQSTGSLVSVANSASDYGSFVIPGATTLAGNYSLALNAGYIPVNNTTFNVVGYGSRASAFDSVTLPSAVTWQSPNYSSTLMSLTVRLQQFAMTRANRTNLIFNVQGTPGNQGVILTSTNIGDSLLSWTPLVTNTFDGTGAFSYTNSVNPTNRVRFYILQY